MTNDEIIAVVTAHKNGKQIQHRIKAGCEWVTFPEGQMPVWNFEMHDYRVKPEPREFRIGVNVDGSIEIAPENASGFNWKEIIKVREILRNE